MKKKKRNHPWKTDLLDGQASSTSELRRKRLADVKRRAKEFAKL